MLFAFEVKQFIKRLSINFFIHPHFAEDIRIKSSNWDIVAWSVFSEFSHASSFISTVFFENQWWHELKLVCHRMILCLKAILCLKFTSWNGIQEKCGLFHVVIEVVGDVRVILEQGVVEKLVVTKSSCCFLDILQQLITKQSLVFTHKDSISNIKHICKCVFYTSFIIVVQAALLQMFSCYPLVSKLLSQELQRVNWCSCIVVALVSQILKDHIIGL